MIARMVPMSDTTSVPVTCAFPGCERPIAPPPATGGRSRYCDDPEHNASTAFRARRGQGSRSESASLDRPASVAGATLRETVVRLGQLLGEFQILSSQAAEHLQVATNPEAVQAELAAARAETLQTVATAQAETAAEQQARLTADEAAEAAQAEAEAARQSAAAAQTRAAEAEARASEAEAAKRQAETEAQGAIAQAEAVKRQAEADIAEAISRAAQAEARASEAENGPPGGRAPGRRRQGTGRAGRDTGS